MMLIFWQCGRMKERVSVSETFGCACCRKIFFWTLFFEKWETVSHTRCQFDSKLENEENVGGERLHHKYDIIIESYIIGVINWINMKDSSRWL